MNATPILSIDPHINLSLALVYNYLHQSPHLALSEPSAQAIETGKSWMDAFLLEQKQPVYGINTGFGSLCETRISSHNLQTLQENLVRSHAVGAGEKMPPIISALMLWFKAHALAKGYSGVQTETVNKLIDLHNRGYFPVVYAFGSLGASGDLAPLAHLCLPLLGEGELWHNEKVVNATEVLGPQNWQPLSLQAKEGLALLNGTQFMTSCGAYALVQAFRISALADKIAALSIDAFDARPEPFDARLHEIRLQKGQAKVAKRIRTHLQDSDRFNGPKKHVQDPYSFRCIPQVHGASHEVLKHVQSILEAEINSVTDNPTIFPGETILSGGNFHGQPLAMAFDYLALAISEWGNISERRIFQLISGQRGLKPFLTQEPGLNSGLMIAQYTAASIASKNKQLCSPASADSIPSSNNQEDHVSMGANAATRLLQLCDNVYDILAIELINASQALWLNNAKSSNELDNWLETFRENVKPIKEDRVLHHDLVAARAFLDAQYLEPSLLDF